MYITLREGDLGRDVMYMQRRLNAHGEVELVIDVVFGPKTRTCLMEFQMRWHLDVDGICGDRTWESLLRRGSTLRIDINVKDERWLMLEEDFVSRGLPEILICFLGLCWDDLNKQESPPGSNKGGDICHLVQGTRITGETRMSKSAYKKHWGIGNVSKFPAWCAIAISSWLSRLFCASSWGDIPFGNWFGGVTQTVKWAKKEGVYSEDMSDVESGDLFVMGVRGSGSDESGRGNNEYGHIGVILYAEGDRIQTIEGNTANGVRTRSRKKSSVLGRIRWIDVVSEEDRVIFEKSVPFEIKDERWV